MANDMPGRTPANPRFSCGPCTKRPGWSVEALKDTPSGRSHRAKIGKSRLKAAIDLTREILQIPADYRVAIVPASDTGAVEMALWSLLGPRGVDVLAWESFGAGWASDIKRLKLADVRELAADYGRLPDLGAVDWSRDVVFTWNGTTSGVRVPDGAWIAADRAGLAICDATSAAFAMELPWDKLIREDPLDPEAVPMDVVFVGGGPAGLAGAIELARLVKKDKEAGGGLGDVEIAVLEKAETLGAHSLSGAVVNPSALRELPSAIGGRQRQLEAVGDVLQAIVDGNTGHNYSFMLNNSGCRARCRVMPSRVARTTAARSSRACSKSLLIIT